MGCIVGLTAPVWILYVLVIASIDSTLLEADRRSRRPRRRHRRRHDAIVGFGFGRAAARDLPDRVHRVLQGRQRRVAGLEPSIGARCASACGGRRWWAVATPMLRPLGVGEILDAGIKVVTRTGSRCSAARRPDGADRDRLRAAARVDRLDRLELVPTRRRRTSTSERRTPIVGFGHRRRCCSVAFLVAFTACFKAVSDAWLGVDAVDRPLAELRPAARADGLRCSAHLDCR